MKKINDHYLALFKSGRLVLGFDIVDNYNQMAHEIMNDYLSLKDKVYEQRVNNKRYEA